MSANYSKKRVWNSIQDFLLKKNFRIKSKKLKQYNSVILNFKKHK